VSIARVVYVVFYGQRRLSITVSEDLYTDGLAYQEPSQAECFLAMRADALESETSWMMVAGIKFEKLKKRCREFARMDYRYL
jgi:hypothetical protein